MGCGMVIHPLDCYKVFKRGKMDLHAENRVWSGLSRAVTLMLVRTTSSNSTIMNWKYLGDIMPC